MKKLLWISCLCLAMALFVSFKPRYTISLLQFNIWQEGTVVSGGFDTVADEIAKADADFVTKSEAKRS